MPIATPASRRIVVADDEPAVRDAITNLLTMAGHVVVAAVGDGQEAIAAATTTQPDVVLTDLRMPGVSGLEVASALGNLIPGLPVIILTAYDDTQLQLAVERSPAVGFLVKGCSSLEIFNVIERCPSRSPEPIATLDGDTP